MIVGVAIRWGDHGEHMLWLPSPNRHHHVIAMAHERAQHDAVFAAARRARLSGEQGFVDERCAFLTREQAVHHALDCGQAEASALRYTDTLFSEDLW